ncbi:MAG: hypothetical protein RLZZ511_4063 [Cyanobacteriota bacterium]|jgi:uncharacterized protein YutE (UPF0331/DUF86 family)
MSEFDPNTLAYKIERMLERIDELRGFQDCTLDQYLANENYTQLVVERLLELVIQAALDINRALLKQVAGVSVERNSDTFIEAGKAGFIPMNLGQKLARSGGFRNVLAHQYDEILPEIVFQNLQEALAQYPDYVEAIQIYLDSLEVSNE